MKIGKIIRSVLDKTELVYRKYNTAIIVAGGSGERAGEPKQHKKINGVPVICHTVNAFENCPFISDIIVVIRDGEEALYKEYEKTYGWEKIRRYVTGGSTRSESVFNGFKVISDETDFVYIHDGARCLVTPEMIENVGHRAALDGCATAATKATDTVKKYDGKTLSTLDRNGIYLVQTPQVFKTDVLRASLYMAKKDGVSGTDEAVLCERLGFKVTPVECGKENMKITVPVDFKIAEAILSARGEKND